MTERAAIEQNLLGRNTDAWTPRLGRWIRQSMGFASVAMGLSACTAEVISGGDEDVIETGQQTLWSDGIKVMSMNVHVDTKSDEKTIGRFSTRLPRLLSVIRYHTPDIIGLQEVEEKNWDAIQRALDDDYKMSFYQRGGGIVNNGSEGVAILAKKSRFAWLDDDENTFSGSERRAANDCPKQVIGSKGNRNVIRVKLEDKRTDRTIDVFNTHFPSELACEKVGMARLLRAYARKFGDNAIVMGDLNTGISETGNTSSGFEVLTDSYLTETYYALHRSEMKAGNSFVTSGMADLGHLYGTKIDHIMTAPAFNITSAIIDHSMFYRGERINCDSSHDVVSGGKRVGCIDGGKYYSVSDLDVYSDHWAVVSVVERKDCRYSDCAASE